jgi:aspartate/methionine/tyrosine aminotransferase
LGKVTPGSTSAEEFIKYCTIKSIYHPGTIFGSNGEGYIRFCIVRQEEKNTRGD